MSAGQRTSASGSLELARLERELAQLQQQLPAHSIPPALLERIDELEEQIAAHKRAARLTPGADRSS